MSQKLIVDNLISIQFQSKTCAVALLRGEKTVKHGNLKSDILFCINGVIIGEHFLPFVI